MICGHLRRRNKTVSSQELGATLLFIAAIIIPLLFFLMSLTIDVSMYLFEEKEVQALLDKGGIQVQRFLPYVPEAEQAFQSFVEQHPLLQQGETNFSYDPVSQISDVMTLTYQRPFTPFFANFFSSEIQLNLLVESQVRVSPFDLQIMLDSSSYLAPPINAPQGWDSASEQPAWVFQQGLISFVHDLDNNGIPNAVDPLVASQQCFSPPFRALKRGAVRMYQYFSSFRDNAVGIGVYPSGTGVFVGSLQDLQPTFSPSQQSQLEFFTWNSPFVRNEHCAAAAEREPINASFFIPAAPEQFVGLWRANPSAGYMIDQASGWQVNQSFSEFSGESLLWSQSVRTSAQGDSAVVLQTVALDLFSAESDSSRGGLQHSPSRQVVIFAGDIPWVNGARLMSGGVSNSEVRDALHSAIAQVADVVESYDQLNFRLFYLAFYHEGVPSTLEQFQAGAQEFQSIIDQVRAGYSLDVQKRFTVQVLAGSNALELSDQVISYLALNRRIGAISR